jgi:hypothetical protein
MFLGLTLADGAGCPEDRDKEDHKKAANRNECHDTPPVSDGNRIPQSRKARHRHFDVKESEYPHEHPNAEQPRGLPESLAPPEGRRN